MGAPTQVWSSQIQPAFAQYPQSRVRPQPSPMVPQYWPAALVQATGVQAGGEPSQIPRLLHCQPEGQSPHSRVPQQLSPICPQYRVPCRSHAQSDVHMPMESAGPSTVASRVASGAMAPSLLSGTRTASVRSAVPGTSATASATAASAGESGARATLPTSDTRSVWPRIPPASCIPSGPASPPEDRSGEWQADQLAVMSAATQQQRHPHRRTGPLELALVFISYRHHNSIASV